MGTVTKAEFEALKKEIANEIQVLKTELCPLEAFLNFRENAQSDCAKFEEDTGRKINPVYDSVVNDMKIIVRESKNEFDKTQSAIESKVAAITQEITNLSIQLQLGQEPLHAALRPHRATSCGAAQRTATVGYATRTRASRSASRASRRS